MPVPNAPTQAERTYWETVWWQGEVTRKKYYCCCVGRDIDDTAGGRAQNCVDSRALYSPNWEQYLVGQATYSHGHDGKHYTYYAWNVPALWNDFNRDYACSTEGAPVINFSTISAKQTISSPFTISATSTITNPITFSSNRTNIATINGNTVTLGREAGNVTITASQTSNCSNTVTAQQSFIVYGIIRAPTASSISYGQSLSQSILSNGEANLPGVFSWTNPNAVPSAGTSTQSITFTPTDTNFGPFTKNISITVSKSPATILTLPAPSQINCGQSLLNSILNGGSANTPGTFSWTNPSIIPNVGTFSYSITFTPNDTTNYSSATSSVSLTITKFNQIINFDLPENINVALGDFTLSASASSSLGVTFSVDDTTKASINGNKLIPKKIGPLTVTASQVGNTCYNAAPSISKSTVLDNSECTSIDFLDCQVGQIKGVEMTNANNIKELIVSANPPYCMEGFINLNNFSGLEKFICRFNNLTGLQNYANKPFKEINISNNFIRNNLENISSPNLEFFNARHNQLSGSIFDLSNKINLKHFEISNNNLTGYVGNSIPPTLTGFFAADNKLTASAVTRILSGFQQMVLNNNISNGIIYLDGKNNSPPDLDGLLYSGFLSSRGWKVKCNPNIFNNPNSPIMTANYGSPNTTQTYLNVKSLFPGTFSTPQQVYVKIFGNVGCGSTASNVDPAIRMGSWPAGTKILLENVGPAGAGCNPTNGVIAGRGGGTCGSQGIFYGVTDAIWVDSSVQLLILNNGIIGGGGAAGADGGGECGEGGGGAGIPAGQVGIGNGNLSPGQPGYDPNKCCGGGLESPGTILCGGGVASNNSSAPGGNLGSNSASRAGVTPLAGFAIKLTAGASYSFVPWSSNPSFAGDARVGSL